MQLLFSERKNTNATPKFILTVSPVPLTATAVNQHVLISTIYSKSVLRAAAGEIYMRHEYVDYFPSYELITNAFFPTSHFEDNKRNVKSESVDLVMNAFFDEHFDNHDTRLNSNLLPQNDAAEELKLEYDVICEDLLLDSFAKK